MSQPASLAIETEHLVRHFGDMVVVDHVDLRIIRGALFAPLGQEGAGTWALGAIETSEVRWHGNDRTR